jgi:hypothetical protein
MKACTRRDRHHMAACSSKNRNEGSKSSMKECVALAKPLEK